MKATIGRVFPGTESGLRACNRWSRKLEDKGYVNGGFVPLPRKPGANGEVNMLDRPDWRATMELPA